jgi:hypothetical protein
MAANTADAPVRIEHTATPFDGALGVLKAVYRKGRELFGRLCFTAAAWELIKAANARRLSVAIRKDKSAIAEVSLVREPRVADAAVFTGGAVAAPRLSAEDVVRFDAGELEAEHNSPSFRRGPGGGSEAADNPPVVPPERGTDSAATDAAIDTLKRAGKLVPASEGFARALLSAGDNTLVTFGEESVPVGQMFRRFLEAQPKVIEFGELATASGIEGNELDVFAKLGVTSQQVEKHRAR